MDLSVRHHPSEGVRVAPVLRVLETSGLVLHEDPDPVRVSKLTQVLRRDRVLRNPPVVAPTREGPAVVLDGANRVTALRELAVPHVVAQVVAYDHPEITLSTWRHYVREDEMLREGIAALPGVRVRHVSTVEDAEARLARRDAVAAAADAHGVALLDDEGDPLAHAGTLARLVALYRGRHQIYRVESGDLDGLRTEYGPGTLVIFPAFDKADILLIAAQGGRLPAGITRHVIPGRALRLNTPLEFLAAARATAEKQAHLEATLQQRWLDHEVRYYAESTYLFDE